MPTQKQIADRAREIAEQLKLQPGSDMALDMARRELNLNRLPKEGKQDEKSD